MSKSRKALAISKRESILGFITLFAALFAFNQYYYKPSGKTVQDLKQKIAALELEVSRDKAIVAEMESRMIASVPAQQAVSPISSYLANSQSFADVIRGLIAEGPGLATRSIQVEKLAQVDGFQEVTFIAEVEGSFPAIGVLIEKFESSSLLAEIESIDITRFQKDLQKCVARLRVKSHLFTGGKSD